MAVVEQEVPREGIPSHLIRAVVVEIQDVFADREILNDMELNQVQALDVFTARDVEDVGTRAAPHDIAAGARHDQVIASAAVQKIATLATEEVIVTSIAE